MKPISLEFTRHPFGARGYRRPAATLLAGLVLTTLAVSVPTASPAAEPPCDLCSTTVIVWQKSAPGGNGDIYAAAPDGSGLRQLTVDPANDTQPALSPDGRRIAFVSNRSGSDGLYVMDAEGTTATPVAVGPGIKHAVGPAWSPDGTTLAFAGRPESENNWDIYVVRIDGTGLRRLTTSPDDAAAPTWSPDGLRIAFHRNAAGNYDIYTVNILTLDLKQAHWGVAVAGRTSSAKFRA